MASRNFHKNRTKERKKRQADAHALDRLRREIRAYEGIGDRQATAMSADRCRHVIRHGKRRRFYPSPTAGMAMAMFAADMLSAERRR